MLLDIVGGFGLSTRLGGLGCDQVVAVKGVDHSGEVSTTTTLPICSFPLS